MARTAFTPIVGQRNIASDVTLTVIDTANGMMLTGASDHEVRALVLSVRAGAVTGGTLTVPARRVPNPQNPGGTMGATDDLTFPVAAGVEVLIPVGPTRHFVQTDGSMWIDADFDGNIAAFMSKVT